MENDRRDEQADEDAIAHSGDFQFKKYDFIETSLVFEPHENIEDIIENKIFKYKYRQCNDDPEIYERRMGRVVQRHIERAKTRDPRIEQDLLETIQQDDKEYSFAQLLLDESKFKPVLTQKTQPIRDYIVSESLQQYRDYYESDREEQGFLEYFDNIPNRDKIRFSEIF